MRTLLALLFSFSLSAQVYEGAVGWGADWTFPASYEVFIVDTTSDNSADGNTLREGFTTAISANARIIVFNGLSGTITLNSSINVSSTKPIYLAGQTAGAGGILIRANPSNSMGGLINLSAGSHIIRGVTFATGVPAATDYCCGDNLNVFGGSYHVIDQCTFLWGADESLSMINASRVTLQRSIIAESLQTPTGWADFQSLASLFSNGINRVSLYRNIYGFNNFRNPLWGGGSPGSPGNFFEMAQNYVVGWRYEGAITSVRSDLTPYDLDVSFINNVFESRAYTITTRKPITIDAGTNGAQHTAYVRDNLDDIFRVTGSEAQNANLAYTGLGAGSPFSGVVVTDVNDWTTTPFGYPLDGVSSLSREGVISAVIGEAGDLRDAGGLTSAIKNAIVSGGGSIINNPSESVTGGYPVISATPLIVDTDNDGIPDGDEEVTWINDTFGYVNALAGSAPPSVQSPSVSSAKKQTSAMLIAH